MCNFLHLVFDRRAIVLNNLSSYHIFLKLIHNLLIVKILNLSSVGVAWADVQTAVVAKEALEGHCIYDGGFCKLHISYSRHTDLSIKVTKLFPLRTVILDLEFDGGWGFYLGTLFCPKLEQSLSVLRRKILGFIHFSACRSTMIGAEIIQSQTFPWGTRSPPFWVNNLYLQWQLLRVSTPDLNMLQRSSSKVWCLYRHQLGQDQDGDQRFQQDLHRQCPYRWCITTLIHTCHHLGLGLCHLKLAPELEWCSCRTRVAYHPHRLWWPLIAPPITCNNTSPEPKIACFWNLISFLIFFLWWVFFFFFCNLEGVRRLDIIHILFSCYKNFISSVWHLTNVSIKAFMCTWNSTPTFATKIGVPTDLWRQRAPVSALWSRTVISNCPEDI